MRCYRGGLGFLVGLGILVGGMGAEGGLGLMVGLGIGLDTFAWGKSFKGSSRVARYTPPATPARRIKITIN